MEKSHEEKVLEDIRSIDPMEFHEPEGRGFPVSWIAIIIIIMFILWYVPSYAIKEDPRPMHVDKIDFALTDIPKRLNTIDEVHLLDVSPAVRNAAIQIGTRACDGNQICYAKAFHNYVRDNIIYMPDPPTEYIQSPEETLLGAGDCEDQAILLFMLMQFS